MRMNFLLSLVLLSLPASAAAAHHGHHAAGAQAACESSAASIACARSPTPAFDANGRLWITWYDRGHIYVQHSDDLGETFSDAVKVNAVAEAVDDQGEDRPQITIGPNGEIYLLWTRKLDLPYTGHIRFSRSLDGGKTFSEPVNVNDDDAVIAHRFPSFLVNERGGIFVAWIDKRDLVVAEDAGKPYAGAALYYAISTDRGESFSASRKLADNSCECCRLAMVLDANGQPAIFYRHVFPGQIRDHALIRFDVEGKPTPPLRVTHDDWEIHGCPHHGPALARSDDVLHMAWFTAGENRQGLFHARYVDGEMTESVAFGQPGAEHAVIAALKDQVVLAWKTFVDDRTRLSVQRSNDGGRTWQAPEVVASTEGASDHPLLVGDGEQLFLSWQTAKDGYRLIPLLDTGGARQ